MSLASCEVGNVFESADTTPRAVVVVQRDIRVDKQRRKRKRAHGGVLDLVETSSQSTSGRFGVAQSEIQYRQRADRLR